MTATYPGASRAPFTAIEPKALGNCGLLFGCRSHSWAERADRFLTTDLYWLGSAPS